jgi:FolB domain-containing protein
MTDQIRIRGLRVMAICGVLPEEQQRRQPFMIDLDVEADLVPAGSSDDLGDTINYGELCERITEVVQAGRFELIERVATVIADTVLEYERAEAVTVELRKLRPPVPEPLDTCGVRIRRTR